MRQCISYLWIARIWENMGRKWDSASAIYGPQEYGKIWEENGTVHQLFMGRKNMGRKWGCTQLLIDFKKTHYTLIREVFYNVLIQFGIPTKLVRLIKCD